MNQIESLQVFSTNCKFLQVLHEAGGVWAASVGGVITSPLIVIPSGVSTCLTGGSCVATRVRLSAPSPTTLRARSDHGSLMAL